MQSLIFQLVQIILLGLLNPIWELSHEKSLLGCRGEKHGSWSQSEDEVPAGPCPSSDTLARDGPMGGGSAQLNRQRQHWSGVCLTLRLDRAGSQRVVVIILLVVMELVFEDKIFIILKILFLIGPSLSRLAFTVLQD